MKDFHKASFQWETFHNLKLCFRSDYSEMKVSMREPNFSTFGLRIRNGKRRNKKKLLWPIGATEMNTGYTSDNAR